MRRESEKSLDFVRKAGFHDVAAIVSQQRYIATMQGRTVTFSTFSDAQFDEAAFEAELTGGPDAHDGLPLSNMRTRASQIDGKLDIDTAAGHGTSIVLTVPIPS